MARDRGGRGSKNNKTARVLNLLTDPDSAQSNDTKTDKPAPEQRESAGKHIKQDKQAQEQIRSALEQELLGETAEKSRPAAAHIRSVPDVPETQTIPETELAEQQSGQESPAPTETIREVQRPGMPVAADTRGLQDAEMPAAADTQNIRQPASPARFIQDTMPEETLQDELSPAPAPQAQVPEDVQEAQFEPFQAPRIEGFQAINRPRPEEPEPVQQVQAPQPVQQVQAPQPVQQVQASQPVQAAAVPAAQAVQHIKAMPMSQRPVPSQEANSDEYICFNVTQSLVEDKADKYIKLFGMCTCSRCRIDVIALAMSNLPAKYVVAKPKEMVPRLSLYESKYSAAVITQVMKACKKVIERPHHKR